MLQVNVTGTPLPAGPRYTNMMPILWEAIFNFPAEQQPYRALLHVVLVH
jgi:hypothetical protein